MSAWHKKPQRAALTLEKLKSEIKPRALAAVNFMIMTWILYNF